MERRDLLKNAAIAVGGAVVGAGAVMLSKGEKKKEMAKAAKPAAPAIVKKRIEMNVVSTWPRDFPGLGTGAQRAAARIETLSEGRIKVNYFAAKERLVLLPLLMKLPMVMHRPITLPIITGKVSIQVGLTLRLFHSG